MLVLLLCRESNDSPNAEGAQARFEPTQSASYRVSGLVGQRLDAEVGVIFGARSAGRGE